MSMKIVTLEEKDPEEIHPYSLDLSPVSYIGDGTQTISSVAWAVYDDANDAASYTDLASTMVVSSSYSGNVVTCLVQLGTAGTTYILRALVTCSGGAKVLTAGRFKVRENG